MNISQKNKIDNRFQYTFIPHPVTGLKIPQQTLQFIADEQAPVNQRLAANEKHTLTTISYEFQGELVKAKAHGLQNRPSMAGTRAAITEFSPKARKNMLETVSRINWNGVRASFITLTYHENMQDAKRAKRDLRAVLKRMYRRVGNVPVLWRLEPQGRGAWHFHAIVWHLPYYEQKTLLKDWREIAGDDTITQVRIERINSASKARSYVSKYVGKKTVSKDVKFAVRLYASWHFLKSGTLQLEGMSLAWWMLQRALLDYPTNLPVSSLPGRYWGLENRKNAPWAELRKVSIMVGKAHFDLKRAARHMWSGINTGGNQGFSLFVSDITSWFDMLFDLISPRASNETNYFLENPI